MYMFGLILSCFCWQVFQFWQRRYLLLLCLDLCDILFCLCQLIAFECGFIYNYFVGTYSRHFFILAYLYIWPYIKLILLEVICFFTDANFGSVVIFTIIVFAKYRELDILMNYFNSFGYRRCNLFVWTYLKVFVFVRTYF